MCNNVPKRKYEGNRKNRKEIEKGKYQMYPETRNKNKTLNNINNEMKKRKERKENRIQFRFIRECKQITLPMVRFQISKCI